MKAQIGIDVSKNKLDLGWLRDAETGKVKTRVFPNARDQFAPMMRWMRKQTGLENGEIQVMVEATGVYHEAVVQALYDAGFEVYVCNPRDAHQFSKSMPGRSKTDKRDGVMLAHFLRSRAHRRWEPEAQEIRELKALLARLEALDKDGQRERNRREKAEVQAASPLVLESIDKQLQAIEAEKARLQKKIDQHFDDHPGLKQDRRLLQSIPGIGPVLSREMVAMLRSRDFQTARQAAAYVGLVPFIEQSGQKALPARLTKTGSRRIRAKLYMAAVTAKTHNSLIRWHYRRMRQRGKTEMSSIGAAMRKLVHLAFGVLKHQQSYNPQWGL